MFIVSPTGGAFKAAALELHERGLTIFPTDPTAKSPRVRGWNKWRRQSRQAVERLVERHPAANVAISCGASRLTVIDADDERTLADAEHRFGTTPLVARTPRGGGHLYFRSTGEGCPTRLRLHEGLNLDVKGRGGYVVAPPSCKPDGGQYRLERGTWADLENLPTIKPGAIPDLPHRTRQERAGALQSMGQGSGRNNALFAALMLREPLVATFDDLVVEGHALNAACAVPMPQAEVEQVARSVWKYRMEGRNYTYKPAVNLPLADLDALGGDGDALMLLATLKRNHGARTARGEPFAVVCRAMAQDKVIPGWTERRFEQARTTLMIAGLIHRVHRSRGRGDPDRFVFVCGSKSDPNVINTPAPFAPQGLRAGV